MLGGSFKYSWPLSLIHKKFNNWFVPEIPLKMNIFNKHTFKPVIGYKKRLKISPIAYLTKLLNNYNKGKIC